MNRARQFRWHEAVAGVLSVLGRLTGAAAAALLLAACAISQVQPGEPLLATSDTGIALLSLSRSGWRDFDLLVEVKGPGDWIGRPLALRQQDRSLDWAGGRDFRVAPKDDPEGKVVALRLRPGAYRIERWNGLSDRDGERGNGYELYSGPLDISFVVEPGRVTYLGNLNITLPSELVWVSRQPPNVYQITVADHHQRDLAVAQAKFAASPALAPETQLFKFPESGKPLPFYVVNYGDADAEPPVP